MTECADSTLLRTHLDHPDATLDEHLDTCSECSGLLRSVADDAGYARRSLVLLDPDGTEPSVDVDAALAALLATVVPEPVSTLDRPRRRRRFAGAGRRLALSGAAAALVLVVAFTPTGRDAVAAALDAFRGERLQVVPFDADAWAAAVDPEDLRALAALGDLDMSGVTEPEEVDDAAEAEAVAGITAPDAPGGYDRVVAMAPGTVRLVLASRNGNGVPAELDGSALVLEVPGAIGVIDGPPDEMPEFVIGRSGPLVLRSEGAPLDDLRAFLLAREELPADLRAQLAAIEDWRSTIPIPVPLDGPGWKEVEVAGRPAIAFGDDSGLAALVLRQDPAGVTVVAGRIGIDRALELAADA